LWEDKKGFKQDRIDKQNYAPISVYITFNIKSSGEAAVFGLFSSYFPPQILPPNISLHREFFWCA